MKGKTRYLILCTLLGVSIISGSELINPSFEDGSTGWDNTTVGNSEYFAPVDGEHYAISKAGAFFSSQVTSTIIEAGKVYTLSLWSRSIYDSAYLQCLKNCSDGDLPQGSDAIATTELMFLYGMNRITSTSKDVTSVALKGAPVNHPNDDGANVWLDQGYRMEFADDVFYQLASDDPISDPWIWIDDEDYDHDMAVGPIITPQGFKGLYSAYGHDSPPFYSEIWLITASGSPPDYDWEVQGTILSHDGDEDKWVIDSHLIYDEDTGRLWMSWGGKPIRVTEMDPVDGRIISHPAETEFDTHTAGTHISIADWNGDEWTQDSEWFEGPALYKYEGYWYLFASYGNLGANYTIRMGRGDSPTGPFYDKDGIGLLDWDSAEREYGNSILLGDDGEQLCPGHPHIWEENGKYYLGYDYIPEKQARQERDIMGIRRLYWVNGWPTIWQPLTLSFDADDHPEAIGQPLTIGFRNMGEPGSVLAVDSLSFRVSSTSSIDNQGAGSAPTGFILNQNYPNPFNPFTHIEFTLPIDTRISLDVVDLNGTHVKNLFSGMQAAGHHSIQLDASTLPSGVYVYRLEADRIKLSRKCVLMK